MPSSGSITNVFFENYDYSPEQSLLEDLIIESISIYGLDFYYLPRTLNNLDKVYLQDDISTYNQAIQIAMYVTNVEGFQGEGSFMSKFGIEIRDQITFTIAKRVFDDEIGRPYSLLRPNESDLIYYPLNNKVFQIKYVENKPIHYPLGILPVYNVFCELFEYSNEQFNTGIPEIDSIQKNLSTNIYDYALKDQNGKALVDEQGNIIVGPGFNLDVIDPLEDNTELKQESDVLDFSEEDPFAENWPENL